jgi:hemin uptake protein HemP
MTAAMGTNRHQEGAMAPPDAGERDLTLRQDGSGAWATTSDALLGSAGRLAILHGGETYRLRVTRQNKLILTK